MRTTSPSPATSGSFTKLERLSVAIGITVMLCGTLVLCGWAMDIEAIKRLLPGFPSMNPMTASALILAGLSLALQYRPAGSFNLKVMSARGLAAKLSAVVVLVFGLLVFFDYQLEWGLGADQLLFPQRLMDEFTAIRSQTALGTALCFILSSLALLFLDAITKRGLKPSELLAFAVMYLSLYGIEQYLFDIEQSYSLQIFSLMALHTAALFPLLAFGILCARPRVGLMSLATSNYPGAIILIWGYPLIVATEVATAFFRFKGEAYGFFNEALGTALFIPLNIFIIGLLLLWSARLMHNSELKRQHSEDERRRFFDLSLDLMCIATTDGYFKQVNHSFITTLGYSEQELLSRPFLDIVHPDDLNSTRQAMESLGAGQDITRFVNRFRCKDGSWRSLAWASSALPVEGNIYASARDITDFLVVQNALNTREEELSITLQSIGDGVLSTDIDGRIIRLNAMAEQLTGWTQDEAIGLPVDTVFRILNEQTRQPAVIPVIETLATGAVREMANHTLLVSRDGVERPIADSCAPIRNRESAIVGAVLTFRDVSDERRAAWALQVAHKHAQSESERLNMVLDSIVDGVIGFNAKGKVQSFNSAAERLYGYDAAEVIGKNIQMLTPNTFQDKFDDYLYNHTRTLPHKILGVDRQVIGRHKDGTIVPLELSIVETAGSGDWQFTGVVRDVSERTRFIEELKSAREQAEAANAAKSKFLATMSHEIRTPINGVIGMLEVLHRTSLQIYQVEMVDLIQESAESLLAIINDILDLSKIEAGKMEFHRAPLDVAFSVENICVMMDRFAEKLNIDLTVFVDPTTPANLLGDAQHLRQVLINLISNAVKFCSKRQDQRGRVSVRTECVGREGNDVTIEFRVNDNGIGMDSATLAQLFAPFEQGKASISRQFGGTGLGLAISQNLTQLMGGEIQVASKPGIGSIFTVRIPFSMAENTPSNIDEGTELDGVSCLVIGKPEGLAPDLAAYLSYSGATVERIDSLEQAQDWARSRDAGAWIRVIDAGETHPTAADLNMAAGLAPESDLRFLAVVIERGKRHNLRQKGAGLFMVDGNALRRKTLSLAVAVAAGRKSLERESIHAFDTSRRNGGTLISREKAIEMGRLILVAEDNETNQKVIANQLALLGVVADITNNGLEALELWRNGNYPLLITDLHMPDMDGYELTAAIRAQEYEFEHIGIIALTANALAGEAKQCLVTGMDDYLSKPARLEDIENILNRWLPPRPLRSSDVEHENAAAPSASSAPSRRHSADLPVNVDVLRDLVGDDSEILGEFLDNFRHSAASISSELQAAWRSREFGDVKAAAHKLKSSARTVGAMQLGERCEQIEAAVSAGRFEDIEALVGLFDQAIIEVDHYLQSC